MTREATHSLEWSSMMLRTSKTSPSGSVHVGHVGLPALVGQIGHEAGVGALRAASGAGG